MKAFRRPQTVNQDTCQKQHCSKKDPVDQIYSHRVVRTIIIGCLDIGSHRAEKYPGNICPQRHQDRIKKPVIQFRISQIQNRSICHKSCEPQDPGKEISGEQDSQDPGSIHCQKIYHCKQHLEPGSHKDPGA